MRALHKRSGIAYKAVQNYCSDTQSPGADALIKIRDVLKVKIDWLLTGEGEQFADDSLLVKREADYNDIFETYLDLSRRFSNADWIILILGTMTNTPGLRECFGKMIRQLRERQAAGGLSDIDIDSLAPLNLMTLYKKEFSGHPEEVELPDLARLLLRGTDKSDDVEVI